MSNATVKFFREMGSGPVAARFTPGEVAKVVEVRFSLSRSKSTGTFDALSAKHLSAAGEAFNSHYFGLAMNRLAEQFSEPRYIDQGDAIDFSYPNADEATWGLEVAYEVFGGSQAQGLADSAPQPSKGAGRKGGASNG